MERSKAAVDQVLTGPERKRNTTVMNLHIRQYGKQWVDTSGVMPHVRMHVYALLPSEKDLCINRVHKVKGYQTQLLELARYHANGRVRRAASEMLFYSLSGKDLEVAA